MAELDQDSHQLCCLVLESLAHLFSWIPLSTSITPTLLASIFHFARFGCDLRTKAKPDPFISSSNGPPSSNGDGRSLPQSAEGKQDRARLGVLAMTCVNELVSKNCVPLDFEEYLLRMFQQTFFLLQRLTRENNSHTVKGKLQELDEWYVVGRIALPGCLASRWVQHLKAIYNQFVFFVLKVFYNVCVCVCVCVCSICSYLEKFTDFLRLFVSVHLRRIESSPQFPIVEFLALLFKYTFNQVRIVFQALFSSESCKEYDR